MQNNTDKPKTQPNPYQENQGQEYQGKVEGIEGPKPEEKPKEPEHTAMDDNNEAFDGEVPRLSGDEK